MPASFPSYLRSMADKDKERAKSRSSAGAGSPSEEPVYKRAFFCCLEPAPDGSDKRFYDFKLSDLEPDFEEWRVKYGWDQKFRLTPVTLTKVDDPPMDYCPFMKIPTGAYPKPEAISSKMKSRIRNRTQISHFHFQA